MDRRQFIKATALTGTSATLASCGNPEYHLIRFIPEEVLTPGIAVLKPSVCPLCSAGCGLSVLVMEGEAEVIRKNQLGVTKMGRAKNLDGDPANPVNQGKLCVRGQAAIQVTYHPDRLGHPLKRTGARFTGQFQELTWDEALSELISKLDSLAMANDQKSLAFLTRPQRGLRGDLVAEFAGRFGAPEPIAFEFFSDDVLRRANALSFGKEQLPTFDFAESRYVIAFGADFLGTWNSPVSQSIGYGQMRQGRPGGRGKVIQVESRKSQTGANADEWVPMKPGLDGVLALGLAHVIMKAGLRRPDAAGRAGTLIEGWAGGLAGYSPEEVEKQTGVAASRSERLAKEFADQRPAVALIGGAPLAQTNALFSALAVNALNALVGSIETPGGIFFTPQGRVAQTRSIDKVADSNIQLLLIDGANPVFATPPAWKVRETLMKIPFIVSFGNFLDETSTLADLVLPDHSFLESWVDSRPESGAKTAVASVAGPVMRPLHDTRAMPDVLLEVGRKLKKPLSPALPWQTFEEMVRSSEKSPAVIVPRYYRAARTGNFFAPQFDGDAGEYPLHFLPYPSAALFYGSPARLP